MSPQLQIHCRYVRITSIVRPTASSCFNFAHSSHHRSGPGHCKGIRGKFFEKEKLLADCGEPLEVHVGGYGQAHACPRTLQVRVLDAWSLALGAQPPLECLQLPLLPACGLWVARWRMRDGSRQPCTPQGTPTYCLAHHLLLHTGAAAWRRRFRQATQRPAAVL